MGMLIIMICIIVLIGSYIMSVDIDSRKPPTYREVDYTPKVVRRSEWQIYWCDYYKNKLGLNSIEEKLLNRMWGEIGSGFSLRSDFCRENLMILFFRVYRLLPILLSEDQLVDLFNYCNYKLKEKYKLDISTRESEIDRRNKLDSIISDSLKEEVEKVLLTLEKLPASEEKWLYSADSGRWDAVLEELKADYSNSAQFYEGIKLREKLFDSIIDKRKLYYDSYSFMVDKDKVLALKFYLHYLHVGSMSETFKYRVISKANQKILFENETQLENFHKILGEHKKNRWLKKGLTAIDNLFVKQRKKVVLDKKAIKSAKKGLAGVIGLLSEYLEDEEPVDKKTLPVMENITSPTSNNIELNAGQSEFVEMFVSQSYTLSSVEVDTFANSKGIFKSQLIDGINDLCYDILDDMLIEEDEDGYILNRIYYEKVIGG